MKGNQKKNHSAASASKIVSTLRSKCKKKQNNFYWRSRLCDAVVVRTQPFSAVCVCVTSSRDFLPRASLRPCHTEGLEVFMQLQHCWRPPAPSNPAPPHPHPQQGGHTSSSDTTAEDARDIRTPVTQRRSCGCRAQRCLFFFNLRRRCSTCMSVSRRRSLHAKGPACSIYKRPVGTKCDRVRLKKKKISLYLCLFF